MRKPDIVKPAGQISKHSRLAILLGCGRTNKKPPGSGETGQRAAQGERSWEWTALGVTIVRPQGSVQAGRTVRDGQSGVPLLRRGRVLLAALAEPRKAVSRPFG